MVRRRSSHLNLEHQFTLAARSLEEARNKLRAGWWASSLTESFEVAQRSMAGLLFGLRFRPSTEKEIRYGFSAAYVVPGRVDKTLLADYDLLAEFRRRAEFEYEYDATEEDARTALGAAERFWTAVQGLRTAGDGFQSASSNLK